MIRSCTMGDAGMIPDRGEIYEKGMRSVEIQHHEELKAVCFYL